MLDLEKAIINWTDNPFIPVSNTNVQLLIENKSHLLDQLSQKSKYWKNTLIPLIKSGHLKSIIDNKYQYPHRIGLFAGLSCMFYCGFCGRNKTASYNRNVVDAGIELYKELISSSPKTELNWEDRFRFSGGQEPLTNPRIGELISYAASHKYKIGMYTNGYMLTEKYIEKQTGLNDLANLRISLYGYDNDSYFNTTKKQNAWDIVSKNIKNLKFDKTNLGFNYIILPGYGYDFLKLIHALILLQDEMTMPISFISVREDFSQDLVFINHHERIQLIDIISEANNLCKKHLPHVNIDYGFALDPLQDKRIIGPLKMAKFNQLDGYGIPQASVQVDILGNVYVYHETAFLDRPGSNKFIVGNIKDGLENVIKQHLAGKPFEYLPSDTEMLDAFDHAVSLAVYAARHDHQAGVLSLFG
jgi:dTDP-4-amino-4,6-dideoxy-D-glucose ammonia-lyase